MWFLVIGLVLAGLKWADVAPMASWPWWGVLWPFAAAAFWWALSDRLGLTRRAQERKMQEKLTQRRRKQIESLGLGPRRDEP